jgi:comEA protein
MSTLSSLPVTPARRLAGRTLPALILAACAFLWLQPRPALAAPPAVAAAAADDDTDAPTGRKATTGKLNLNTATPEQLELLPGVGPAKAERIIAFRQKHGAFKRVADLRRVKGFGRKTLKKLEPFLDIKGETTLAAPNE